MTLLSDFFADHDLDSLRAKALDLYAIDILGVYCLHTGRKVGTFDPFVIQFACDEEAAADEEQLIDGLVARVVASMRPSPMLNKPDRVTLLNLAERFPVDVLSYLVNRLHGNRHLAVHRNTGILDPYLFRIAMFNRWTALAAEGVSLTPWIHWLLELDAKRNLHDLTPPGYGEYSQSLFTQVTPENADTLLAAFEKWTFARLAEYDKRDREALAQTQWMRGNSMTHGAYVRSWLENPEIATRKQQAVVKAKNATPRVKSEKTRKLDAKVSQFLHLLDDIIDGGAKAATPVKPKAKPMTAGMLFKKKESL